MRSTAKPAALIPRERIPLNERLALSLDEAADAAGVSRSTIKKLIREGRLHPSRATGRTLINPVELKQLLFGESDQTEGKGDR